ncbi:MAG: T9SS type A sorting domain-containing protein, partial [Bacteroidota bacterium]
PQQDDDDNRYGSHGFWQYTQHIVVYDDTDPVAVIDAPDTGSENNFDCAATTVFTISITDACSIEDITTKVTVNDENEDANASTTINGDTLVVTVTERRDIGNYKVSVEVYDGCGIFITEEAEFDVFDDKAPAPICREDLVVELMPQEGGGAAMTVWASDFIASPLGDCSGQGDAEVNVGNGITQPLVTQFSINRLDSTVDATVTGLTVTCEDADNAVEVEIHAWDGAGNNDFCVTSILVQDNNGVCDTDNLTGEIAGLITNENNQPIEDVEVQLSGSQSKMFQTLTNGQYQFSSLLNGGDFTVRPGFDLDHASGVSTFDLILIQKHILGVALLDSPYKIIAADVNNSRNVSVSDLIQLRKLILNIDSELANNTSWRFVDAEYSFPNPSDPWQEFFPEIKNINNLEDDVLANFVGMKIGDVNGSVILDLQPRSNEVFQVVASAQDNQLKAGEDYEIVLSGRDLAAVQGFQFTMALASGVEIVDIHYGQLQAPNLGVFQERGMITVSWDAQEEIAKEELLRLLVRPSAAMALSDVLSITSRMTKAEAYNGNAEKMAVSLSVESSDLGKVTKLYQNQPNPFEGETQIRFELAEASATVISIQDMMGRTVKVVRGDFGAGLHEVRLKNTDLPAAGIYYYTLEAGEFKATRKMILVGE